jgi:signal transduction histidine kinase
MARKYIPLLHSLRFRLIASVVTIEIIMLSLLVWNNISIIHTTHTDRLRDTATSMIQQIANTSGRHMIAVDYATLEDYLSNIIHYKELSYIVIVDRDDNAVIALGTVTPEARAVIDSHPAKVDDGIFDIAENIQVAGQPMGQVIMGFSLSLMDDAIHESRNRGITIAMIEIILTIIVTVLIGLGLTRRLSVLSNAAAEVEAGNYSVSVPTETDDEVGKTAIAFNRMVTEVSNRTQLLENEEARSRRLLDENRTLIHTSLEVQEEERKHLARELHDEMGQCLTAIQADAELIRDISRDGDKRIETSANAIMDVSSRVYDVVHSMMHRLRPSILDNLGLVEALKEEVEAWKNRNTGTSYDFKYSGDLSNLGENTNIKLYRIVQECLTNITKYASADSVKIELHNIDEKLLLKVIDNGVGFDKHSSTSGLGLIGIRERVTSLGGSLMIDTAQNKGVSITIIVPATALA